MNYKLVAASTLLVLLVSIFLLFGKQQYERGYTAATTKISLAVAESVRKQQMQQHSASEQFEQIKEKQDQQQRIQYVEIEKIVERPVYHNECFDADGLRQANAAIRGTVSASQLGSPLP